MSALGVHFSGDDAVPSDELNVSLIEFCRETWGGEVGVIVGGGGRSCGGG